MPAHIKKALHQLQQDHFFHSVRIKRLERNIFTLWGDLIAGPFSCEWHGFSVLFWLYEWARKRSEQTTLGFANTPAKITPKCEESSILCKLLRNHFEVALFNFFLLILPL